MTAEYFRDSSLPVLILRLDVTFAPLKVSGGEHCRVIQQTEWQKVQVKNGTLCKFTPFIDFLILQLGDCKGLSKKVLDVKYRRFEGEVVLKYVLNSFFVYNSEVLKVGFGE